MLMSAILCAASGTSLQQRITCAKTASPLSRRVAVCIDAAAHGTPGCISAFAGRRRSISRPRVLVTTAAADGSTGGAAGTSSKVDSRRGRSSGKPSSSSGDHTRDRAAGSDRPAAGTAQTRRQATGHHFQRPPRQAKPNRNTYDINDDLKACTSVARLLQLMQHDGPAMTYVNLAAAIVRLQKILSMYTSQQQQQVTQTAADIFSRLWKLQQPKLPQCKARQLANMIYSASLLPTQLQQKFHWVVAQHLLPAFMQQLSSASPQAVSNVMYGLAASGQQLSQQTTELLIERFVAVLPTANTQDIANTLWAVATMKQKIQPTQELLNAFCAIAQTAKPQEIANTLWALATIKQQVQQGQLDQMVRAFVEQLGKAAPQAISNTLWAVATMKQHVEQVEQMDQMVGAFVVQLGKAAPQAVSNTLWACAEFKYLPIQLLAAPALIDKSAAAKPQALSNTAWACGQLGHRDEQLMSALLNHVLGLVDTSESNLISSGVNAQDLANLCWSVAVLDMRQHSLEVLTLVQAAKLLWASMVSENLLQLYQVHMWLTDHSMAGGEGLAGALTAQQLQHCRTTWHEMLHRQASMDVTTFQESVSDALRRIPIMWLVPPAMEQVSLGSDGQLDGAALIDITARTADGVWLAVEVDGPMHFRRPDRGLMGPTLYRNRALAVRGYVVVSVPYYEWNAIRHSHRQQYMLDKVTAALEKAAANGLHHQHLQPE